MTLSQVDALSDRFAVGPAASRPRARATRIGLQLPNIPQFVIAYFGILKAGCVVVPLNVLLTRARDRLSSSAIRAPRR